MEASRAVTRFGAAPQSKNKAERHVTWASDRGDLALRAGRDGYTVRVHRGVVAAYSRVLEDVLASTHGDELPLPGKS